MKQTLLTLVSFALLNSCMGIWSLPNTIDLHIDYYNNSNCTFPLKSSIISNICLEDKDHNVCCNDLLDDISLVDNINFDTCYNHTLDNDRYSIIYSCNNSTFKSSNIKLIEICAIVGVLFIIIFMILLFVWFISKCITCNKSKDYNHL